MGLGYRLAGPLITDPKVEDGLDGGESPNPTSL